MRKSALLLSAVIIGSALSGAVQAQQQPADQPQTQQQQPRETEPAQKDGHSEGTKPENMGSTGWTGGTGGSHIGTSNTLTEQGSATSGSGSADTKTPNSEAAKDQPLTATGVDLKGEPTRFPANKTPE